MLFAAGRRTHKHRAFYDSRRFLWFKLGEVKILWVRIMGVTLVYMLGAVGIYRVIHCLRTQVDR